MNNRLTKVVTVAGLILLLALPAAAYSQLRSPTPRPGGEAVGEQLRGAGRSAGEWQRGGGRADGWSRRGFAAAARGRAAAGRLGLAARALAHADSIELTDAQREQISAAQRGFRESSINLGAQTRIAELDLRELLRADQPDIGAIETKMREIAEQRIAGQTGALRFDAAVSEILTGEQIEQLDELRRRPGADDDRRGRLRRAPRRGGQGPMGIR